MKKVLYGICVLLIAYSALCTVFFTHDLIIKDANSAAMVKGWFTYDADSDIINTED